MLSLYLQADRATPNPGRDAGKAAGEALNDSNAFSPKDALSKVRHLQCCRSMLALEGFL